MVLFVINICLLLLDWWEESFEEPQGGHNMNLQAAVLMALQEAAKA